MPGKTTRMRIMLAKRSRLKEQVLSVEDCEKLISGDVLARLYKSAPGAREYGLGFKRMAECLVGHGGASGTRAAVDLKNDRVVVILTQAGSKNTRPLIGGGHKLAVEILAKENKK